MQGTLSLLPGRDTWNYLFQRHVTRSVTPSKQSLAKRLAWCETHIAAFEEFRGRIPSTVIELGTGWIPTVPVGLYLCGVDRVVSIDIHDLRKPELQREMLDVFYAYPREELKSVLPHMLPDRFDRLLSLKGQQPERVFEQIGVEYVIEDAQKDLFPAGSVDYFVSNTTLEHISRDVIAGIFTAFRKACAPDGLMSHLIDMSDHYSHFDSSITPYHFLQHDQAVWRLVNNGLLWQNRLRVSDYRTLHTDAGFEIVRETNQTRHADKLKAMNIAAEFRGYAAEELAVTSTWMISQPT